MKSYIVNTVVDCNNLINQLKKYKYHLWQFQYQWDSPEGWFGWFFNGKNNVEVRTTNHAVQERLINQF